MNNQPAFLKEDPWRILRSMAEFVDSFETLSHCSPAVTVFGSARLPGRRSRLTYPDNTYVAYAASAGAS